MVADSILGKLYIFWLHSGLLSLLEKIFAPFRSAWPYSKIVRFFERESGAERVYGESLVNRIITAICDFFLRLFGRVYSFFSPATERSLIVRLCRGSRILSFEFLLFAFIFVMFVTPHGLWSNSYAFAGAVGLFGIYAFLAGAGKRQVMYPRELGLPFLLFAVACVWSLVTTTAFSDSFRILLFFAAAFLFTWLLASDLSDRDALMRLMGFIYAAVILTALYAVAQRFMGVEVSASYTDLELNKGVPGRVYSTLDNPNNYAEFLVLFTPLCAAFAMNVKSEKLRLPLCLMLALPMLAMIMTYSRSSWLSIFLAAFVFVYYSNKKLVPVLFLLCVLAVPFLPQSVLTRLGTIVNTKDSSASHRFQTWECILAMLADKWHWLTGIGLGPLTFSDQFPAYAEESARYGVYHSQMLYMELMMETGLLGFVSFLWLMGRTIKDAARALYRSRVREIRAALAACCAAFIGIAVASVFEYIWFYPRVMFAFFILLGVCLACMRMTPMREAVE